MRYLVILIVSALFLQASAGILPFSVTADVTWNSKYVWRGLPCDEETIRITRYLIATSYPG